MRVRLWTYKPRSKSGRALGKALQVPVLKHKNSAFRIRRDDLLINWGGLNVNAIGQWNNVVNTPHKLERVVYKHSFFSQAHKAKKFNLPPSTSNANTAYGWIGEGNMVLARTLLTANGGRGIIKLESRLQLEELVKKELKGCKLYVKYIKKKEEYRVHLCQWRDEPFVIQRKAKRRDADNVDYVVRNHEGGFIFAKNDDLGEVPACVIEQAKKAFKWSGLDFGAVDVIYNEHYDKAYVLEINTAPGLEGTTLDSYCEVLTERIQQHQQQREEINQQPRPIHALDMEDEGYFEED